MKKSEEDFNMFDWWKKVFLDNYANFNGRARRTEYWYFTLVNILIFIPMYLILIFGMFSGSEVLEITSGLLLIGYFLVLFIPSIAVTVRRLHDTDKSGWYYLLTLIPLLSLVILIFMIIEGDQGRNSYGKDPKDLFSEEEIEQIGTE